MRINPKNGRSAGLRRRLVKSAIVTTLVALSIQSGVVAPASAAEIPNGSGTIAVGGKNFQYQYFNINETGQNAGVEFCNASNIILTANGGEPLTCMRFAVDKRADDILVTSTDNGTIDGARVDKGDTLVLDYLNKRRIPASLQSPSVVSSAAFDTALAIEFGEDDFIEIADTDVVSTADGNTIQPAGVTANQLVGVGRGTMWASYTRSGAKAEYKFYIVGDLSNDGSRFKWMTVRNTPTNNKAVQARFDKAELLFQTMAEAERQEKLGIANEKFTYLSGAILVLGGIAAGITAAFAAPTAATFCVVAGSAAIGSAAAGIGGSLYMIPGYQDAERNLQVQMDKAARQFMRLYADDAALSKQPTIGNAF